MCISERFPFLKKLICLILEMYHLAAVFCFNFSHYIRTTRKPETLKGLKQKAPQHFKPFCSLTCTHNLISLGAEGLEVIKYTARGKQNYLVFLTRAKMKPTLVL